MEIAKMTMKRLPLIFLLPLALVLLRIALTMPRLAASSPPTPTGATSETNNYNVEVVGHIGGAIKAVYVQGDRAYVGEGPCLAVLDLSNPTAPTVLGRSAPGTNVVQDVYLAGNYAYVAAGADGLRVVDISNPARPVEVGVVTLAEEGARGVVVAGNYAYVSSSSTLWVVDVSNPGSPTLRGDYGLGGGPIGGVAVSGNYVYVAAGYYGGMNVVDVSNPDAPAYVTTLSGVGGSPRDVIVLGAYAFVFSSRFNGPGGIFVFDVSDPQTPFLVRDYPFSGYDRATAVGNTFYLLDQGGGELAAMDATDPMALVRLGVYRVDDEAVDVAVAGGLAYVASGVDGLQVVDVSQMVAESGYHYPPGAAWQVIAQGQYAYVVAGHDYQDGTLHVVDVSDPTSPQERSAYRPPASRYIADVAVAGNEVYLVYENQNSDRYLQIVDISNPDAPSERGAIGGDIWGYGPDALAVAGDYAYTVGDLAAFRVIDVSDPLAPTMVATHTLTGYDVAVAGRYAYVAMGNHGLKVLDVLTPTTPVEVGTYTAHQAREVAVAGDYAYLAEGTQVTILNISDPTNPTPVGSYDAGFADISDVTVADGYLYLAGGDDGLWIVDVSDPAHPQEAPAFPSQWPAYGVAVAGGRAYVAAEWKGLRVLDVSGLAPPVRSGGYNASPTDARNIAVVGDYAYVADAENGLKIVDVSDPAAPSTVGVMDTSGSVMDVALSGPYAYLADYGNGLTVVDVSNPAQPQQVGGLSEYGVNEGLAVAVYTNTAYLAAGWYGLYLVDISNPLTPTQSAWYIPSGNFYWNDVTAGVETGTGRIYAYAAAGTGGLRILDVTHPSTPTEAGFYDAYPAYGVALDHPRAYVAAEREGLQILDVTNPFSPTKQSAYAASGDLVDVMVDGHYAYLAEDNGLRVVDVSNPQRPVEVGAYRPGSTSDIALSGSLAYLISDDGLHVVDLSDPRRPQKVGAYQLADVWVKRVIVSGDYAGLYVYPSSFVPEMRLLNVSDPAHIYQTGVYTEHVGEPLAAMGNLLYLQGEGGHNGAELYVVDISNPAAPTLAEPYDVANVYNQAEDMVIAGDYAYVSFDNGGVHVLDLINPAHPSRIAEINRTGGRRSFSLAIAGNHLYIETVASTKEGITIYDISNPIQPTYVQFYTSQNPQGVAASGGYMYIADYEAGLRVVNVSNPAVPVEVGSYRLPEEIYSLAAGVRLYLLESDGTLRVVDVSSPATPLQVGLYKLPDPETSGDPTGGVAVAGGYVYVADGAGGLYILRVAGEVHYTESVYLPVVLR